MGSYGLKNAMYKVNVMLTKRAHLAVLLLLQAVATAVCWAVCIYAQKQKPHAAASSKGAHALQGKPAPAVTALSELLLH